MTAAGAARLGLQRGKLRNPLWNLTMPLAFLVSGAAFLVHEQNGWFFSRSAFGHHAIGWLLVVGAIFPLALTFRRQSLALHVGFAGVTIVLAVLLFCDRDLAPILGHLSPDAGVPHR
jgi:hypothetical protein